MGNPHQSWLILSDTQDSPGVKTQKRSSAGIVLLLM